MIYDNWKQETPPSDIDFEPMTEQEEQEAYLLELVNERIFNKAIIKQLLDITKASQPYIYSQLKKLN